MTKTSLHIITRALMLLIAATLSAALVSCHDDVEIPDNKPDDSGDESTVVLSLSMSSAASRAEMHPDISALSRECTINDVSVFTYSGSGLNADSTARIIFSGYYDASSFTKRNDTGIEVRFQVAKDDIALGDRMIVLANMGNLTGKFRKLGDIQKYVQEATFTRSFLPGGCNNFAMANAYATDGEVKATPTIDAKSDYYVSLSVERLAARIDIDYSATPTFLRFDTPANSAFADKTAADSAMVYEVRGRIGEDENQHLATVYLTHVLPINVMQQGSYALKHISADTIGNFWENVSYGGSLPYSGKIAQAYVVEPRTSLKPGNTGSQSSWYGDTYAGPISRDTTSFFSPDKHIRHILNDAGAVVADSKVRILAYADENTQSLNYNNPLCLTGIILRAHYIPHVLYKTYDEVNKVLTDTLFESKGEIPRCTDIWRYTPQNCSTTESDVMYFANEAAALKYANAHPDDMAEVKLFPQGVCFYYLWIRHADAIIDPASNTEIAVPMGYGIVRNHVYRVGVSFKGIGQKGVKIEAPDNLEATIAVRPWRVFTHDEIVM